jgi:hypothetical protein
MRLVTAACFVIIVAGAMYLVWQPTLMVWVHSNVTGKEYEVKRAPDQQKMADRLAMLEQTLHALLTRANADIPSDARIRTIRTRWDGTLSETEASEDVAFSVDKTSVSLCLRDATTGQLEEYNASVFVLIHELAHIATSDYGHSPEFWQNMKFLLELAEKYGVYAYQDYSAKSTTYCGHPLGSSPLTCVKQRTCSSLLIK